MLSVLIVNWNTKDMLRCCLSSLRAHPPAEEHEVIVVDNDSHDGSADMVEREFPDAVLVRSGSNLGYAAGNNLAFSVARGNYLLTLNPDTEFEDASLTTALEVVKSYPQCGALGVKLVGPDKTCLLYTSRCV